MNDNGDLNLKKINIGVDTSGIIRAINEPFILLIQESFRFQERRNREYIIEKRKEDIIPGFLSRRKRPGKPIGKALRDTKKFFNHYNSVIQENIRSLAAIQKGTHKIAFGGNGKVPSINDEEIEQLMDRKIEERFEGIVAILTNGNRDNIS